MYPRILLLLLCSASLAWRQAESQAANSPAQTGPAATTNSKEQILVSARKVALLGALGHVAQWGLALNPSEKKAQELLEKEVRKWGRFTIVDDPAQADLVLVLFEGNRAAGGGGVIRTARLSVVPGGQPPKRGDLPLWDEDASGSILGRSGAPKVIAKFRAYLETLDKTVVAPPPSLSVPAVTSKTNPPAPPPSSTPPEAGTAPATSTVRSQPSLSPRSPKYVPPFEIIGRAKTYTLRGKGAAGEQGTFDKFLGVGKYSDIQSAMGYIHEQMGAWGQMEYVKEVPEADLVILVYQWDTRTYSRQFHGVQSAIQIAEGREAFQRDDPSIWASGTVNGSTKELISDLRFEMERSVQLQSLSATHEANKNYNHGRDWIESANKKTGSAQSDLLFEAVAELRKSLRADYGYAPAHERLAAALQKLGFHSNAAYEYRLALQLQPGMQDAMRGLIDALASIPDYEQAVEAAQQLERAAPDKAGNHLILGNLQFSKKDYAAAAGSYREAIRLEPSRVSAHLGLGAALYFEKLLQGAEGEFRELLRLKPDDEDALLWLGLTLNDELKPEEAIGVLQNALKLNSKTAETHYELGRALHARRNYDEALAELNEALTLNPKPVRYHREVAHTLADAGKNEQALAKFREIAHNLPESSTAHQDLGVMLLAQKQTDEAMSELERAIQLDEKNAAAYFQLGRAREAKGDAVGAQTAYDRAHSLDPDHTQTPPPPR